MFSKIDWDDPQTVVDISKLLIPYVPLPTLASYAISIKEGFDKLTSVEPERLIPHFELRKSLIQIQETFYDPPDPNAGFKLTIHDNYYPTLITQDNFVIMVCDQEDLP